MPAHISETRIKKGSISEDYLNSWDSVLRTARAHPEKRVNARACFDFLDEPVEPLPNTKSNISEPEIVGTMHVGTRWENHVYQLVDGTLSRLAIPIA